MSKTISYGNRLDKGEGLISVFYKGFDLQS